MKPTNETRTKVLKLIKKAPVCPKCQVPMKPDGHAYSDKQLEIMAAQEKCKHDFSGPLNRCLKCKYVLFAFPLQTCPTYLCPKCFDSYKEDYSE